MHTWHILLIVIRTHWVNMTASNILHRRRNKRPWSSCRRARCKVHHGSGGISNNILLLRNNWNTKLIAFSCMNQTFLVYPVAKEVSIWARIVDFFGHTPSFHQLFVSIQDIRKIFVHGGCLSQTVEVDNAVQVVHICSLSSRHVTTKHRPNYCTIGFSYWVEFSRERQHEILFVCCNI